MFFKKEKKVVFSPRKRFDELLSLGFTPLDAILILFPEKTSKDFFESIETETLSGIRPKVNGKLWEVIVEELIERGSLSLWMGEYFHCFLKEDEFCLFAGKEMMGFLIGPLECKEAYLAFREFSLRIKYLDQTEKRNKEMMESLETLIRHCLKEITKGLPFDLWVSLIEKASVSLGKEEARELTLIFEDSIDCSTLEYDNLVWILNNLPRIKNFAIAEMKKKECNY